MFGNIVDGIEIGRSRTRRDDDHDFIDAGLQGFFGNDPQERLGDSVAVDKSLQWQGMLCR
jgi:hypothetical protein